MIGSAGTPLRGSGDWRRCPARIRRRRPGPAPGGWLRRPASRRRRRSLMKSGVVAARRIRGQLVQSAVQPVAPPRSARRDPHGTARQAAGALAPPLMAARPTPTQNAVCNSRKVGRMSGYELVQVGADYPVGGDLDVLQPQRRGRGRRQVPSAPAQGRRSRRRRRRRPRRRKLRPSASAAGNTISASSKTLDAQRIGPLTRRPPASSRSATMGTGPKPATCLRPAAIAVTPGRLPERSSPKCARVSASGAQIQVVQRHPMSPRRETHRQAAGRHFLDHPHHVRRSARRSRESNSPARPSSAGEHGRRCSARPAPRSGLDCGRDAGAASLRGRLPPRPSRQRPLQPVQPVDRGLPRPRAARRTASSSGASYARHLSMSSRT